MKMLDLKKWIPGPDIAAGLLGFDLADFAIEEVTENEEIGNS